MGMTPPDEGDIMRTAPRLIDWAEDLARFNYNLNSRHMNVFDPMGREAVVSALLAAAREDDDGYGVTVLSEALHKLKHRKENP